MSDELFRFTILRPADPVSPGRVVHLSPDDDVEELDEKVVDRLVEQLSPVARAGREEGGDPADAVGSFNLDVDLQSARAALSQRLLADSGDQGQGHIDLADAARGIEMVMHARSQGESADLRGLAKARLVAPPKATDSEGESTEGRFISDPRNGLFHSLAAPQPRPSGFALLRVVKQQVLRYEAGEVAHIENVLAGESRERIHRTLDRTEDVSVFDTETTREESRDLQTAERFELATESQKQLEKQSQWEVGTDVTAKYPPYVEVGLDASAGGSSVRNTAERRATQFSREITQEAASAVSTRIREQRKRTVLSEIEETNRHAIENAGSPDHVVGIYQWVEKVMQAQVFSYGQRLMYDLTLPEPGAFLAYALTQAAATDRDGNLPEHPGPWELKPEDLTEESWVQKAAEYNATDVTAPPMPVMKSVEQKIQPGSEELATLTHTAKIAPPEGYRPTKAWIAVEVAAVGPIPESGEPMEWVPAVMVSVAGVEESIVFPDINVHSIGTGEDARDSPFEITSEPRTRTIVISDVESGEVPVAIAATSISAGAVTVSVRLEPTEARLDQWHYEAYSQIRQVYDAKLAAYRAAVEGAEVSAGIEIEGRSPTENRRLERDEVKKQAITAFTRQHFWGFDAIEQAGVGDGPGNDPRYEYPELDLSKYQQQGKVIRFFEQAFEWEHMSWVLYPYYWSRKATWIDKLGTTGADPQHVAFLRAGAARVQVPVRPGFQMAVLHYQSTGEVWEGNQPPQVHDPTYLPIVEELAEQLDRPDAEEMPEGAPWEVRLPTDLVKLNPDGTLPRWEQDDAGNWVPVAEEEPDDDS